MKNEPLQALELNNIPTHIAITMDGNGRWAQKRGAQRIFGHQHAVEAVRQVAEGCAELGVSFLTLFAFSTENWARPKSEVNALMELLVHTIHSELPTLHKNNICLKAIGHISDLPTSCQNQLDFAINDTAQNNGMILTLALSYSGRSDILQAVKALAFDVKNNLLAPESIDEKRFATYLSTAHYPDPALIIRTSGELRISNFLLWELAYSELYFTETLWPDFRKKDLLLALQAFQNRQRRFGKTNEQIQNNSQ